MSDFIRPLVLTDDGKRHEPAPPGRTLDPALVPVSGDKSNLLEIDDDGLILAAQSLLSQTEQILSVADGKLRSTLAIQLNAATNELALLGAGGAMLGSVKLPLVPGLPVAAEILKDFAPPPQEYGVQPKGAYMHLRFQMSDGTLKDIYYNVSDLVDVYTVREGEKVLGLEGSEFFTELSFAVSGDELILRGKDEGEVTRIKLPFTGETLTLAEFLQDFTPPPPHGANAPALPESNYLHLHFDADGAERDMYIDFGELIGKSKDIWGKRTNAMPTGAALDELLEDMPIGAYVWSNDTDGLVIYLTPEEGDTRYVGLTGDQTVGGVKTFTASPLGPTPPAADSSAKLATTAFVSRALEEYDDLKFIWGKRVASVPTGAALDTLLADMPVGAYVWSNDTDGLTTYLTPDDGDARYVGLAGDQTVAGVKTYSASPLVPTVAAGDKSLKAASTAFVDAAITAAHANDTDFVRLSGDQSVTGIKTFTQSPQVPTAPDGDNTTNVASTQFVTGAIAVAHASAPTLVRTAGDQTIDGVKTFLLPPVVPTQPPKDSSTKAASTAFVMQALSEFDFTDSGGTWGARVNTLPTGAALDTLLADMPIGAYIWDNSADGLAIYLTQAEADARYLQRGGALEIGPGLKQGDNGRLELDLDPAGPLRLTPDGKLTVDQSGLVSGGVSTDAGNALVAGVDGKPFFPGNWGTL